MRSWALLACILMLGCGNSDTDSASDSVLFGPQLSLHPAMAGQGTTVEISLESELASFDAFDLKADFGPGVSVDELSIDDVSAGRIRTP